MTKLANLPYGHLKIDLSEQITNFSIFNFMSGKRVECSLSTLEFGQFQDFAITLEHIFFLFIHENKPKIIAFNSSKDSSLFECDQLNGWKMQQLTNVIVNAYEIERKVPGCLSFDLTELTVQSDKSFLLVASLFKVYLIRNDFNQNTSTIQRIFDYKTPSVEVSLHHIDQLIVKACGGNDFLLILAQNGHVYSMGTGSRGELGISPMEPCAKKPKPIQDLIDADIRIIDIACGGWHGLALTLERDVYAWGLNSDGQCGLNADETKILEIPYPINLLKAAQNIRAELKSSFITLEDGSMVVYGKS